MLYGFDRRIWTCMLSLYAFAAGLFRTELVDVLDAFRSHVKSLIRCFIAIRHEFTAIAPPR